jgi:hypothetical protein
LGAFFSTVNTHANPEVHLDRAEFTAKSPNLRQSDLRRSIKSILGGSTRSG